MPRELTGDTLLPAVARARPEEVIELLRGRDEAERRAVAPAIRDALARSRAWEYAVMTPAGTVGWAPTGASTPNTYHEALALAALGTTGLTDVRRTPLWPSDEGAFAVLADRRPRWLAEWASTASWRVGRMLTRAGLIEPLRDDARIEALIAETRPFADARLVPSALLREDPELLEHELWRLFEVEGREVNLQSADPRDERGWNWALREAVADGRIDRARLLDATLEALTRDFGAYRNRWYTRLHTDLEPTLQERLGFADRYLAQLHSPHGETAAWALDRVEALDREQPLDSAALLATLPAVLTSTRKRTVKGALTILRRIADRDPARADECARLAAEALAHEAPDVQALALAFDPPSDALERFRDVVAPTNRAALGGAPASPDAPDLDALAARIEAVAPAAREALELDAALAAARDGTTLPLPEPPLHEPRLGEPLTPIETLEELAASLLRRLNPPEAGDDEHEQERALDAIARFCGSRAPFDGPLKPVLARAWAETWPEAPITLDDVIIAWARGTTRPRAEVASPFGARLAELAERCAAGRAGPLLAAPTHRGGWIDPPVLVERAARSTLDPHSPDLVIALLRLAPERRAAASAAAAELPGADALRCALGGPDVDGDAPATVAARLTRLPPLLPRPRPAARLDGSAWYERELWPDPPPGTAAWLPWRWLDDLTTLGLVEARSPALDWPGCRDPAHVSGRTLGLHVDLAVVEPLLDPGEPVTAAAAQLLAATLGAEIAAERMLGVDAAIAAIDSGRLDAALLGGALLAEHEGPFVPARVARSLTSVAQVSVLHAETVREALDALLAGVTSPKGMLPPLTLLNELCEDAGAAVTQRRFLESITGSSKTAKTAATLLERTGTSRHAAAVAALALEARVARAERWTVTAASAA